MKTTARKMSIFVFMAVVTTTTLALGTSTAMAAKTHTHVIQLKSSGDDWFPTSTAFVASNTHTHHHTHLMSSNGNHMTSISGFGSRNNDFPTGWIGGFSPTQYGPTVSPSYHQQFPTGMFAGINGANSGFVGNNDIPTGWAFNNR
jgi:hypothetical protein